MLGRFRVLDLTTERGLLCGQLLADLGADVIAIEPPEGSPARALAPFADAGPPLERSLHWWAYARGKRSCVLNLERSDGRDQLRALVARADFLLESFDPGWLASRGLGWRDLAAINPRLVYVSISPYGQDGPKAHWAASELTLLADAGPLVLVGDDDRPPVRIAVPQGWLHAGAEAAVAALIAHTERMRSGIGQQVDVSAQQAIALATQGYILATHWQAPELRRMAGGLKSAGLPIQMTFPAADGFVAITFLFGSAIGPFSRRLMEVITAAGECDPATRDKDWIGYTAKLLAGEEPRAEYERVKGIVAAFTKRRTKAELLALARERDLLIAPIATLDEVLGSAQLAARDYWRTLPAPNGEQSVRYPGPFARFGRTPLRYSRRAPALGEHTSEVLDEVEGLVAPTITPPPLPPARPALDDIKILDLMWVMAGPTASRVLADYGATIVRVESPRHIDTARTLAPFFGGVPGAERSGCFTNLNVGKLMLSLDLAQPGGREVFLDLVRWADVVTESFTPGTMARLGLDYASLVRVKPDLVMLSSCLMGQTGPLAAFAGYGNLASGVSGFAQLGGWPDRPPALSSAYTDYVAPRYIAAAILAAVDHHRRTGEGQHIDLAQGEASLHFLAPALLDASVNGRVATRRGNRDAHMAPHGVYPARGDDRWVAIAVRSDAEWTALCHAMGQDTLATAPALAHASGRLAAADRLDDIVATWTADQDAAHLEAQLQAAGIAAAVVRNSGELVRDPQLLHRGHFVAIEHPEHGTVAVEGARARLSRTPAATGTTVPALGHDALHVLREILGYDETRITALATAGLLG